MNNWKMIRKSDNTEVKTGEIIYSNNGMPYTFKSLTRGRLGPKVFVFDESRALSREFFNSVFDITYSFKEIES